MGTHSQSSKYMLLDNDDENDSAMYQKSFKIDISHLIFTEGPINTACIKTDYRRYFANQSQLSIFEQCFFTLVWKIYAPLLSIKQLTQLEKLINFNLKQYYLFFCYNIYNLSNQTANKPTVIPRKKRQLPLTHKLTRNHNFITLETEEKEGYCFLINFLLSSNRRELFENSQ